MDLLVAADAQARVQEAVFFAVADLLNVEVDLLFFDPTSTYFETEITDELRRHGHSKDHRPDLPQIIIGLAVTRQGIRVRVWVWPGNTNDNAILPEVKDGLRGWRLGRVVTVVDRGFSADVNLAYLRRAGGHWIAGERMRDGSPDAQAALSRQGRYQTVRDNLRIKEVRLDDTSGKRWIVCHNPLEAERDKAQRDAALARIDAELERIRTTRARDTKKSKTTKKRQDPEVGHRAAECALRDHPTLGRWLRQLPSGRLTIDKAKVAAEERLDGKYLLSTSDPDLSAEDVALGYKNLLGTCSKPNAGSGTASPPWSCDAVEHRARMRGSLMSCCAGSPCSSSASLNGRTGHTWRRINTELGRLQAVTLHGPAGTVVQTTAPTEAQTGILGACDVPLPPRVTHLHPA